MFVFVVMVVFTLKWFAVRHWWLTPILATQEAEIRRITVQTQPRQIVHKTLSQKYPSQKGLAKWLKVKPQYQKKKKVCIVNA
jgi:hypothetical protein